MSVELTSNVERARNAHEIGNRKRRGSWEYFSTESLVEAVRSAKSMGWGEKKVQVKAVRTGEDMFEYFVEPYEKDCGCPGLLQFEDYFLPDTGHSHRVSIEGEVVPQKLKE
jgi:hypothetical protein